MRRLTVAIVLLLFCCGFAPRKSPKADAQKTDKSQRTDFPDSLAPLYEYTDAIWQIYSLRDTAAGRQALLRAIERDSAYAPALYLLGVDAEMRDPAAAMDYSRRAFEADTANRWYTRQYARTLIIGQQ